jgi:hypothetical protein
MDDRPDNPGVDAGGVEQERALYERDLYSWAMQQAALLRAGRIAEADVLNIAEEINDVASTQYHKLHDALEGLLAHLLKWDRESVQRLRQTATAIKLQRIEIEYVLEDSPGIRKLLDETLAEAYETAKLIAAGELDVDEAEFPETCPYSFDDIMERPIDWPPAD